MILEAKKMKTRVTPYWQKRVIFPIFSTDEGTSPSPIRRRYRPIEKLV